MSGARVNWYGALADGFRRTETNSTMVIFPGWTFLGPLRWWIPWRLQGALANVAKLCGFSTMYMPKYSKKE